MWNLVAAELPATPDNTQFYLLFAGGVVAAIASVAVAYITRGRDRTAPSPPPPTENGSTTTRERVAVLEATTKRHEGLHEDAEDRDDVQDRWLSKHDRTIEDHGRALEDIVRFLDRDNDGWRQ